ncbi:MAG: PEP/pyruvate-binding domain-containing protein [Candidatus Nanoarchaeia archaeon]
MQHIITLSNVTEEDVQKAGWRAVDLNRLQKTVPVPLSFVVPNLIFEEFLLQNGLVLDIKKIIGSLSGSKEDYDSAHSRIKELFRTASIPDEFKEELHDAYEALSSSSYRGVQSLLEESEPVVNIILSPNYNLKDDSLTDVILNIQGFNNFLDSLKSCWLMLYSEKHLSFRSKNGISDFNAGLIVQSFLDSDCVLDAKSKGVLGDYEITIDAYFGLPDITNTLGKDNYSVSRETFGITSQKINIQEYLLLKNVKSGTLLKRTLGKKGVSQKIIDKYIFETARLIERLSSINRMHYRIVFLFKDFKYFIFLADRIEERLPDKEKKPAEEIKEAPPSNINTEEITAVKNEESLSELLSAPIVHEKEETPPAEPEHNEELPKTIVLDKEPAPLSTADVPRSSAFAWETLLGSDSDKTTKEPVKAIILEKKEEPKEDRPELPDDKITVIDDNDEFIFEEKTPAAAPKIFSEEKTEEKTPATSEESLVEAGSQKKVNPDYDFFMGIILDIEPAVDQEIMKVYQEKLSKMPKSIPSALEELEQHGGFPEKEQIFKLKSMKELLESGETINLETFLEVTERLRKIL